MSTHIPHILITKRPAYLFQDTAFGKGFLSFFLFLHDTEITRPLFPQFGGLSPQVGTKPVLLQVMESIFTCECAKVTFAADGLTGQNQTLLQYLISGLCIII